MLLYTYADIRGQEVLQSTLYPFNRTRVSHHALVTFVERDNEVVKYVAKVLFFVRAQRKDPGAEHPVVRLAVCELHKAQAYDKGAGELLCCDAYGMNATYPLYACTFSEEEIKEKVAMARAGSAGPAYFMPYSNLSRADRASM